MKVCVVGAGISGLTAAAILKRLGHDITVYDVRDHIGGNCADRRVDSSTRLHIYGPHIFHTDNEEVWAFLNNFTSFNNYQHRVIADTPRGRIPIPFNKISASIVGDLTDDEVRDLLFVDYSEKMWGIVWDLLPDVIRSRVPQRRDNDDCRYFTDKYQGIPVHGYQPMFEAMAEGCEVLLGVRRHAWQKASYDLLIYTGMIDEFYNFELGRLQYKTLDIVTRDKLPGEYFPAAVINQCNRNTYTRKADHSWWHSSEGLISAGLVTLEHPRDWESGDIPYYPIPYGRDQQLADAYTALTPPGNVIFLGRQATYKYLNIDQAVLQVITTLKQFA